MNHYLSSKKWVNFPTTQVVWPLMEYSPGIRDFDAQSWVCVTVGQGPPCPSGSHHFTSPKCPNVSNYRDVLAIVWDSWLWPMPICAYLLATYLLSEESHTQACTHACRLFLDYNQPLSVACYSPSMQLSIQWIVILTRHSSDISSQPS